MDDQTNTNEQIPIEEDKPKHSNQFPLDNSNTVKPNEVPKDVFNTIKGHHLLGWCVGLLTIVYGIEFFFHKGQLTQVGESFIEIIKLLIFSLTGYLFGTQSNNRDN
ncbi:hypothetical protein [Streptococcus catagoni]|uniref:hypothetical protein n=1 Tax=Streptococcus catagoni TaxID=2654874 RepID=UPI00140E4C2E|nr:hypothetical protein [Streptococcus catagoni]